MHKSCNHSCDLTLITDIGYQLEKVNNDHVSVEETPIIPSAVVRNLGIWLDSNLSTSTHMSKTCSSALYHLYNIRKIKRYLSHEATETLVHALVTSRLDYCNSMLHNLPSCEIKKIQRVQNTAARLIYRRSKFCHTTPLLKELHWLTVTYRIQFKILVITSKVLHGMSTAYLEDLVRPWNNARYGLRCASSYCIQVPCIKSKKTLGDRSFFVSAAQLWNNLPLAVKSANRLSIFKSKLKTHLYNRAFVQSINF